MTSNVANVLIHINESNATLITVLPSVGAGEKDLRKKDPIKFTCSCGKEHTKTVTTLIKTKAYCFTCTKKRGTEQRILEWNKPNSMKNMENMGNNNAKIMPVSKETQNKDDNNEEIHKEIHEEIHDEEMHDEEMHNEEIHEEIHDEEMHNEEMHNEEMHEEMHEETHDEETGEINTELTTSDETIDNAIKYLQTKLIIKKGGKIKYMIDFLKDVKSKKLDTCWTYNFDLTQTIIENYSRKKYNMTHKRCGKKQLKNLRQHIDKDNPKTRGQGCGDCDYDKRGKKMSREFIIEKSKKIYKDQFDYSNINQEFINYDSYLTLFCNDHKHTFTTTYRTHFAKDGSGGCKTCSQNILTKKIFLETYSTLFDHKKIAINLDAYNDNDYIKIQRDRHEFRCLKNSSHPTWSPLLYSLLKNETGCPLCNCWVSKIQISYFNHLSFTIPTLQFAKSKFDINSEHKMKGNRQYRADGYHEEENHIIEFHGCIWHGCPKCFKNRAGKNPFNKLTYDQLFEKTKMKKQYALAHGYKYSEMWECEWTQAVYAIRNIQRMWKKYLYSK